MWILLRFCKYPAAQRHRGHHEQSSAHKPSPFTVESTLIHAAAESKYRTGVLLSNYSVAGLPKQGILASKP